MIAKYSPTQHIIKVANFEDLVAKPFQGFQNAICWSRTLQGDFEEIVKKFSLNENIVELDEAQLLALDLSEQGQLAREILLHDLKCLKAIGADPILNLIKSYERDDSYPFFPTDVYSFHVDRSPIPVDTFLCTYYGASSEIIANDQALQKIHIPVIREELKRLHDGSDESFELFLSDYFFDLHYQANSEARPTSLGLGHMWKLATDNPESQVPPCIHRAPKENPGETRLLLIC